MPRKANPKRRKPARTSSSSDKVHVATVLTPNEYAWIARQADRQGLSVSAFLRSTALALCVGFDPDRKPTDALPGQRALFPERSET